MDLRQELVEVGKGGRVEEVQQRPQLRRVVLCSGGTRRNRRTQRSARGGDAAVTRR
jgi:hypothetical protein